MSWDRSQIAEAYEGGASIRDIAMFSGLAKSTVSYHLTKAKVQMRPPHVREKSNEHVDEGHDLNAYGQCKPCNAKKANEKYKNDPEWRERRLAQARASKQRKKERNDQDA